jgi:hypothetical protein
MKAEPPIPEKNSQALKFVAKVASLLTVEEYADELADARAISSENARILAFTEYDSMETVEKLIRWARHICDPQS